MAATRLPYVLTAEEASALEKATVTFADDYMSRFDPSHDVAHIRRVHALSQHLLRAHPSAGTLDAHIITLSSLLHDVGDKKYASASDAQDPVQRFLLSAGAPRALAAAVQTVVGSVSYSNEKRDPAAVRAVLAAYPELAVVQDADRLDALGAVGVGRAFVFAGVNAPQNGMEGAVRHFGEKLLLLEDLMKTDEGRRMARVRTERLRLLREWWDEEVSLGTAN